MFLKEKIERFTQDFTHNTDRKLTLFFGSILFLMLGVVFVTIFLYHRQLLEDQRASLLQTITNTLVAGVEKVSFSGKYHSKQFIDETVKSNQNVVYIMLHDERGGVVASSDIGSIKESIFPVDRSYLDSILSSKGQTMRDVVCTVDGQKIKIREVGISYKSGYGGTQKLYIMRIGVSVENIERAFVNGMLYFGLLFFVVAILGVLIILVVSGYFATSIKKLAFELKGILDRAPFMMYFMNRDGRLEKYSASFEAEFLKGGGDESFYNCVKISDMERFKSDDEAVFGGIDVESHEYTVELEQQIKHYIFIKFPILTSKKGDEVELLGGIAIDITDIRSREREIEFWKERYELVVSSTNDGFWDWSVGSSSIYLSPKYYEMLGYEPPMGWESLNACFEIMHPDDRGRLQEILASTIEKRSPTNFFDGEFRFRHANGEYRWMHIKGKAVNNDCGDVVRLVGVVNDITARKDIEERMRKSQEDLSELNKYLESRIAEEVRKNREKDEMMIKQARLAAMGEMISNIAHQWRQPLTTLGGIIMNLQDAYEAEELDQEKFDEFVKKANWVISYMSKTVDDFRNFFRPDKKLENFDIKQTIDRVLKVVDAALKSKGISVKVDAPESVCIDGYPNEYAQVLLNIINNAKDAIVERGISNPVIKISLKKDGEHSLLSVADNAGGIPVEIMDKIFEPYFTTKDVLNGTGIGLYMAKMIIEKNMGGRVMAFNNQDGAEFRIVI